MKNFHPAILIDIGSQFFLKILDENNFRIYPVKNILKINMKNYLNLTKCNVMGDHNLN